MAAFLGYVLIYYKKIEHKKLDQRKVNIGHVRSKVYLCDSVRILFYI